METYIVHPNESQERALKAFLEALEVPFETTEQEILPSHVVEGIRAGQNDIKAGRFITLEEFKQKVSGNR